MLLRIIFIIFRVRVAISEIPSYNAYYGQGLINFSKEFRSNNIFLESIFSNIDFKNTSQLCNSHLKIYKEAIQSNDNTWSKYYLDSSGCSLEPGYLLGNTVNLGDFDECVSQKNDKFNGKYCWLKIELHGERPHRLIYVPNNNPIVFSICVPDSCGSEDVQTLTKPMADSWNFTLISDCQTARPPLSSYDIITMCFFAIVILFTLSTLIPKEWRPVRNAGINAAWNCFDLNKNLNMLFQTKEERDILACLNGIRFLGQSSFIWVHAVTHLHVGYYPVKNKFVLNDLLRSWNGAILTELILSVDTFFMMSGVLLTYNCLKRKSNLHLLKYYFHRYIRLTPPLLATLLFVLTFYNKLCNGPFCKIDIDQEKELCQSYWWTNLLYINNFYPGTRNGCLRYTWYVAADWQLFLLVSPIVVVVINKWPRHINKVTAAIFLSSLVSTILVAFIYNIPPDNLFFNSFDDAYVFYDKLYNTPQNRASSWAIGMYLGVILHRLKQNKINLSSRSVLLGWCTCAVALCGTVLLELPFLQDPPPSLWLRSVFGCLRRNIYVLSIGWIIFAASSNKAGPLGTFLSSEYFEPLGKLTYSMYLIHMPIVSLYMSEARNTYYYSTLSNLPPFTGLILISTLAALLLYLTFEAPFIEVEKLIFRKHFKQS